MLKRVTSLLIVFSLFTFSNFGLFDAVGIRRESQLILISISMLGMVTSFKFNLSDINFKIYISWLLFMGALVLINNVNESTFFGIIYSLIICIYLSSCRKIPDLDFFIKSVILVTSVFSALGLVQFILVNLIKDLPHATALFNDQYLNSQNFVLFAEGPYGATGYEYLRILGFSDGAIIEFSILTFTRLRSFLHEPSLVIPFFLLPGLIGLTYSSRIRKISYINIAFSLLSLSSAIYIIFSFAVLLYLFLKIKIIKYIYIYVLTLIALIYLYIYYNIAPLESGLDNIDYLTYINSVNNEIIQSDNSKFSSFNSRVGGIAYAQHLILENFILGSSLNVRASMGLFLWSWLYGGVIGAIMVLSIFYQFNKRVFIILSSVNRNENHLFLIITLLYILVIQALFFNDYGFNAPFGLVMLYVLFARINDMALSSLRSI